MRTFSREHWQASLKAWEDGDFSDEWKPYRHAAAMRGMIYPPDGTKWDGWDEDEPSQRALLIRAIRECPRTLMAAIESSSTWSEVVGAVIRERQWAEDMALLRESDRRRAKQEYPDAAEARVAWASLRELMGSHR